MRLKTLLILVAALTGTALSAQRGTTYFPVPDAAGGWRALTDSDEIGRVAGVERGRLDEAFRFVQRSTKNGGLLVVRRGWLVYERYFGRGHREAAANLASVGKSFTSVAIGMLLAERRERFPDGLDQQIFTPAFLPPEAFPVSDRRKSGITLGQLLAFTACIRGNTPGYVRGEPVAVDPPGPDGWPAMLDEVALGREDIGAGGRPASTRTLWCEPGEGYSYATASIHLASIVLRHVTGQELQAYLDERLAKPLGWGRWGFGYKHATRVRHTPGGGGIVARPTDMLRFGYLLRHEGRWDGQQLVPADYVRHATRRSAYNPHSAYSLQFDINVDGQVAGVPRDAFWKGGSGGHALYVIPSLDLVVWKLGGRDGQYDPRDTGMDVHPDAARGADPRDAWKATVDDATALRRTLQMVVAAIAAPLAQRAVPCGREDLNPFVGAWLGGPGAQQVVEQAIERTTASMSFFTRPFARRRLWQRNEPPDRIVMRCEDRAFIFAFDDAPVQRLPIDGAAVRQDEVTFRLRLPEGPAPALLHIGETDEGRRESVFRLSAAGTILSMDVTVTSGRLPEPLRYTLEFSRSSPPPAQP